MTPNHWKRLKPLLEQALRLPPEGRAAFAEKIRLQDEELGRYLADLIREDKTGPLEKPFIDFHDLRSSSPIEGDPQSAAETVTLSSLRACQVIAGRFRVLRHVGNGGMGDVFEAEDLQLKDRVALKMIRPEIASNPVVVARFKREILLGKRVAHPNVCRIHDLGFAQSDDGTEMLFLTMEFLSGVTLASRIKRGPFSAAEALPLIEDMADGLAAAHQAGVVHRDFKSGNVMLVNSSNRTRAVITDFGLARAVSEGEAHSALTKPGAVAGTVAYMAPEQIRSDKVTTAADIYSLGVVIYQMVTGRLPFIGDSNVSVALQHVSEAPPSPRKFAPHLNANWEVAILRCLRKVPGERFGSAADLKAALLSGPAGARPKLPARVRSAVLVSLPVVFLILLGSAVWVYREHHPGLMTAQQRVAVLEFENVGGDPENQAFCEGLMETLSSQLTELEQFQGSLSVIPASDIRREKVTSAREAQRDLDASLVITGSVQRSPNGIRLTMNVVDARQLRQLRSHALFIQATDAVSMQQGVIAQVTNLLDIQLRPEAQHRLAEGTTPVPGAYDSYLQGSGYLLASQFTADQAITEFQHALERDPDYALAHAGLGRAYWAKYQSTKERSWVDKAWQECSRSMELGPQLSEPHITLATLNSGTGHYDEAIRQAQQAIQIDPREDRAYTELARALDATGQTDKAEATMKQALSLRPDAWYNYVRLGIFYARHNKPQDSEKAFKRVVHLVPYNPIGYADLGSLYYTEGRQQDAETMLKESIDARPTPSAFSNLATIYFSEGRYAEAVPIMEKLVADGTNEYVIWGNLGDAYRWTPGDKEKAEHAYQKALALAAQAIDVNPSDAAALSSSALYHAKLGEMTLALENIKKALVATPNDKTVLFKSAVVFELAGERAQALEYIRRAILGGYSSKEIATEPELGKLRQDPLYQAAVSLNHGH